MIKSGEGAGWRGHFSTAGLAHTGFMSNYHLPHCLILGLAGGDVGIFHLTSPDNKCLPFWLYVICKVFLPIGGPERNKVEFSYIC